MCLTIPAKIISINKNKANVKIGEKLQTADCQLVDAKVGDWVVLTNSYITAKLSAKEASDILQLIKQKRRHKNGVK